MRHCRYHNEPLWRPPSILNLLEFFLCAVLKSRLKETKSMRQIGIGVIGTGFMGKAHAFAYRAVSRHLSGDEA